MRSVIILRICGILSIPLGIAIIFMPGCDWVMGLVAFLQGVLFLWFAGYIENN